MRKVDVFHEANKFEFTTALEQNWISILKEYQALHEEELNSWHQTEIYNNRWKTFELIFFGRTNEANIKKCPKTAELLKQVPGLSSATFSILGAQTHITPHKGITDAVLRCHLGLIIPDHTALRVGDETRQWQEGKCLVFDDMTEHEAWNKSNQDRIILLLDFLK